MPTKNGEKEDKDVEPKNCNFANSTKDTEPYCVERRKYFLERGDIIMNEAQCEVIDSSNPACGNCRKVQKGVTGDLISVLDFTFVKGRLLLGMRCGVLIVSDFLNKLLNIKVADLITSAGKHKNTFPPINKLASSTCCKTSGCRKTIVAAYSAYDEKMVGAPKELFISFDLGDTFQVKLLAEHTSALNLIWGMYKLYGNWLLYHQLLNDPDPEDLKNDVGKELHPGYIDLRSVADWDSLTLETKEKRFLYGETSSKTHINDAGVKRRAWKRYIKIRTEGALRRYVRYRRLGREINLDLTPQWLLHEIDVSMK